ncbi:hypothetical protein CASFOL_021587 [Castilleja foliolosa]|uniref:Uncharacterized protein n=1 Tax=Castilleja foliolosa TaxID=1961234 RepID=A0ABD3CXU2_9LAMI
MSRSGYGGEKLDYVKLDFGSVLLIEERRNGRRLEMRPWGDRWGKDKGVNRQVTCANRIGLFFGWKLTFTLQSFQNR